MFTAGKPVAAVCHGPAAFRHTKAKDGTPLVSSKSAAGFANTEEEAVGLTKVVPFLLEDVLKQNGGKYSKAARNPIQRIYISGILLLITNTKCATSDFSSNPASFASSQTNSF